MPSMFALSPDNVDRFTRADLHGELRRLAEYARNAAHHLYDEYQFEQAEQVYNLARQINDIRKLYAPRPEPQS